MDKKRTIEVDSGTWESLVVNPVMETVKKTFRGKEEMQDVIHVTSFILNSLFQEMGQMIPHMAYTQNHVDFASMCIVASAAPKLVYKTLCRMTPAFIQRVMQKEGLPGQTLTNMKRYFSSLEENSGTRLSLMFIRDAVYISSPSNTEHLAMICSDLTKSDIQRCAKLLTLAMCSKALGTPVVECIADLKAFVPLLIHSLESPNGCTFISQGDLLSYSPATESSVSLRKTQIIKFLSTIL